MILVPAILRAVIVMANRIEGRISESIVQDWIVLDEADQTLDLAIHGLHCRQPFAVIFKPAMAVVEAHDLAEAE